MHLPSGLAPLVAFLGLLTKATAQDSAPFTLKSHVLAPANPPLNGLYFNTFSYHPGGFFFATLSATSASNPALVSVLTGPTGNQTLKTSNLPDFGTGYLEIAPGTDTAPSAYDSVQFVPGEETTFGLHFANGILKWRDVQGKFYGRFFFFFFGHVEIDRWRGSG